MQEGPYGNAMTEIALALAMAFFAIMVLTLVSVGAGDGSGQAGAPGESPGDSPVEPAAVSPMALGAMLQTAADMPDAEPSRDRAPAPGGLRPQPGDLIVIYHQGRFLDAALHPLDPATLPPAARVVLALHPQLDLAEALAVRARVPAENLVVSALNAEWIAALSHLGPAR